MLRKKQKSLKKKIFLKKKNENFKKCKKMWNMKNRIIFLMKKKENICFFKKIFCCVRIVNLIFSFDINYSSFFSKNIYGKYDAFFWNGIFTLFGMEFFVSCSFAFYRQRFFEEKCERHLAWRKHARVNFWNGIKLKSLRIF